MTTDKIKTEELNEVDIHQLCVVCDIAPNFVLELVEYGTIEPEGATQDVWRFSAQQITVIQTAKRLHVDLEINHPGIALAVELLQEIDEMREKLALLEKK
jgi:chaperone modulatory protein CbpM